MPTILLQLCLLISITGILVKSDGNLLVLGTCCCLSNTHSLLCHISSTLILWKYEAAMSLGRLGPPQSSDGIVV